MEDNFNNSPEEKDQTDSQPVYTDPNADVKEETVESGSAYQYTQSGASDTYAGYRQNAPGFSGSGQNGNYQYQNAQGGDFQYQDSRNNNSNSGYQDNLNYNIGSNMGYNQDKYQDMDTSPMSMGDWLLTILAAMIPCGGIVLYFVWAFSSTGNVNRRNFCRAQLIVLAVVFVLYLIIAVVFGVVAFGMA